MKRVLQAAAAVIVWSAVLTSCTTSGGVIQTTCRWSTHWAIGDSITNESTIRISGWPNVGPALGYWSNQGLWGAHADARVDFALAELAGCGLRTKPTLIVLEAGLNDLAGGTTPADLEASYTKLIASAGVPVRVMTLPPYVKSGPWASLQPQRQAVNAWIRANVPDVDCAPALETADGWLNPAYSIDGLVHLNAAGEAALATCVMANVSP
jgi:lysophospholipase L1-like esterase